MANTKQAYTLAKGDIRRTQQTKLLFAVMALFLVMAAPIALAASPNISNLPDVQIRENSSARDRIINLFSYASDSEDNDTELDFRITNQTNQSLIYCFVGSDRYISCDAPSRNRTGTSTVTVRVHDTDGRTDTDSFNVRVSSNGGNDELEIAGLPDVTVEENSGDEDRLTDLFDYTTSDNDDLEDLDFRILSQSNTSLIFCSIEDDRYFGCEAPREDSTGTSTIVIEVEDSQNNTSTDSFRVEVASDGGPGGMCEDIVPRTRTIFMDESDTTFVSFDIDNRSDEDFTVNDIDVFESSQYLSVSNIDFDESIEEDETGELSFDLRSTSITFDREATVSIEITGEFDDGTECRFRDVPLKTFRVQIDNSGNSSNDDALCEDIGIDMQDLSVDEDERTTESFTIRNDNSRSFTIDTLRATEDSSKVTIGIVKRRSSIGGGDEEEYDMTITTQGVTSTTNVPVEIEVSGRFSNDHFCSVSKLNESFDLTIRNNGDNGTPAPTPNPQPTPAPTPTPAPIIQIRVSQVPIEVSGSGIIELENAGDDLANVSISVLNAPNGVSFSGVSKQLWRTGERIQIEADTRDYEGNVSGNVFVSASEGSRSVPVSFKAIKTADSGTTGLVNFATTAGIAIGLILVVVLAIIGIISIVSKK